MRAGRGRPAGALATIAAIVASACAPAAAPTPAPATPDFAKRAEGRQGMVVTSHDAATRIGVAVLREGGNAMDAAVAAAFALAVADPSQTGLGGGGALTVWRADTRRAEHLTFYPRSGGGAAWAAPDTGPQRPDRAGAGVAVPGQVAGLLAAHARHGRLPRARVLAPAIALARQGVRVSPLLSRTIGTARERLAIDPRVAARFLPDGEPLAPGARLVQPELAALLDLVSAAGADAFYRSAFAHRLAAAARDRGGRLTAADLAGYAPTWTRPLCTVWRGHTVLGAPPPMGGPVVLELLHLLDLGGVPDGYTDGPATAVTMANAVRLAHADGWTWRGDPAARAVPAAGVSHRAYAASRAALLRAPVPDTAPPGTPWAYDTLPPPPACAGLDPFPAADRDERGAAAAPADARAESNTSHLSVVDADGNAVSMTTTIGRLFGTGVWSDGVFLNSAAWNLDSATAIPGGFAVSTMAPTVLLDGERVRLVVGAAGSQYIQPAVAQVTLRMLVFGEDPALALAAPRLHAGDLSRIVDVEPGFAPRVYEALRAHGFETRSRVGDLRFGGVHAILVTPDGRRIGAADPRRDGTAAGY